MGHAISQVAFVISSVSLTWMTLHLFFFPAIVLLCVGVQGRAGSESYVIGICMFWFNSRRPAV